MASDVGVGILNSLGANTFDVGAISQTLAESDVAAKRNILESNQTKYNSQLTGYDNLQLAFEGFMSQVSTLTDIANFQKKTVDSSDPTVVDATITGTPNDGIYQVEVQALAASHTLASQTAFASSTSVVGEGVLSFNVGGSVTAITIDSSNSSLSGIQNAVNNADIGVNATVVNVGSGYKLMFSAAQPGASNTIDISVTGDLDANNTDASGLSNLITANMDETVPASDAVVKVNGLTINSSDNNLEGVIDGVTLNLRSADLGSTKSLEINQDTDGLQTAVEDFVDLFNALDNIIDNLGSYETDEEDETKGSLKSDSALRMVKSQIREAVIESIPGLTGSVQSMSDIGITTESDGSLALDSSLLSTALSNNPEAVGKLFAASANISDNLVTYKASSNDTVEGTYNLTVNTAADQAQIAGASIGAGGDITIDGTNDTLHVKIDGNESQDLVLNAGLYTRDNLAIEIARVINNDSNVSAGGGLVSVEYDDTTQTYTMTSEKFGSASKLELVSGNFLTSGITGLGVTAETTGVDAQGFLEKDGTLYTFVGTGQDVKINSILDGSPKGLEFTIGGSTTGARGTIDFNRGYADKLGLLFDSFTDEDSGVIGNRVTNINTRLDEISEQQTKLDERYDALELKYRIQFGSLQTLLSQMESTRESLTSLLVNNNNNSNN